MRANARHQAIEEVIARPRELAADGGRELLSSPRHDLLRQRSVGRGRLAERYGAVTRWRASEGSASVHLSDLF